MKTFSINVQITGKVTVPDSLLRELRIAANEEPTDGGSRFLYDLNKATQGDDEDAAPGRQFDRAVHRVALRPMGSSNTCGTNHRTESHPSVNWIRRLFQLTH